MRSALRLLCIAVALAAAVAAGAQTGESAGASAAAPGTLTGRALLVALRGGGMVLYLRHTSTDFGQSDEAMTTYDDCTKQRNLTEQGRAEARAIGAALQELRIPVGPILASPYCRTMETARLVFGDARATTAVRGGPAAPEDPERYAALRALLSTFVPAGSNVAIASHGNPFRAVAGLPYLAEGEMAVVAPEGNGRFRIVARIRKDDWVALASAR